jgi:hypothetical protein
MNTAAIQGCPFTLPTTDGHGCTRMNDKGGGEPVFIGVHLWLREADRVGMSLTQRREDAGARRKEYEYPQMHADDRRMKGAEDEGTKGGSWSVYEEGCKPCSSEFRFGS